MKRVIAIAVLLLCFFCLSIAWAETAAARSTKPNIVFILADDLGYMDIHANNPNTFYETPNLDLLASEGMRFTSAYAAAPVCSPTRASILTGKYPARLHLTDFIKGTKTGKMLPADTLDHLPLNEVTVAEALRKGGYYTGLIGKWHLGGAGYLPEANGFDVNIGGSGSGSPSSYFSPYKLAKLADGPKGEYLTDRLTQEAIQFISENASRPFFLFLSHYGVHIPLQAPRPLVAKYEDKAAALPASTDAKFQHEGQNETRQVQDQATYAAMVESLDNSVGQVMQKLEQLGLSKNTVIIFFSDNGGLSTAEGSPTSNVPLRAGKGWLYEGGIREPLLVKWPGATDPGSVSDLPVISADFYPTLLEIAGLPLRPEQHCDGVSLAPFLRHGWAPEREAIFWHYPHYSNQGGSPASAVRRGDWKLIRSLEDNKTELYNLKDDIGERQDQAAALPGKVSELNFLLDDFLKDTHASFPKEIREETSTNAPPPPSYLPVKRF
jgi:arylsulfatase A-like enzyme